RYVMDQARVRHVPRFLDPDDTILDVAYIVLVEDDAFNFERASVIRVESQGAVMRGETSRGADLPCSYFEPCDPVLTVFDISNEGVLDVVHISARDARAGGLVWFPRPLRVRHGSVHIRRGVPFRFELRSAEPIHIPCLVVWSVHKVMERSNAACS